MLFHCIPPDPQHSGIGRRTACLPRKDWTVLVYWAVDNNLYEYSKPFLKQFEETGTGDGLNIVVQYDYPDRRPTERFLVQRADPAKPVGYEDLDPASRIEVLSGNVNSAAPETLSGFVRWSKERYPARRYALIIGSHGSNWSGVIDDVGTGKYMSLSDLRGALTPAAGELGIDLLIFDACKMAFLETLIALEPTGIPWIVGSPFDLNGFDHITPLQKLSRRPKMTPRALGREYVRAYPRKKENAHLPEMAARTKADSPLGFPSHAPIRSRTILLPCPAP